MPIEDIYNYRPINNHIATAGQPTRGQLHFIVEEGFQAVISLTTYNSDHPLIDESEVVKSFGIAFYHIPVDWQNPKVSDFNEFETIMQQLVGQKIFIHCAANFRVTAFYGLYAMKHQGWTEAQADALRAPIWQGSDYPIWESFVQEMKTKLTRGDATTRIIKTPSPPESPQSPKRQS